MFFCKHLTPWELQQCWTYPEHQDKSPELVHVLQLETGKKRVSNMNTWATNRKGEFVMLHFKVPCNSTWLRNEIFTLGNHRVMVLHFSFSDIWPLGTYILVTAVCSEQGSSTGVNAESILTAETGRKERSNAVKPGLWAQIIAHSGAYESLRQV